MPRARSRRCAMTVNPATETRPMKTRPSTAMASTIVAGPTTPLLLACEARETVASPGRPVKAGGGAWPGPYRCCSRLAAAGSFSRIVTWVGAVTWPGTTRANSSLRSVGFSTMPVTCQARPSAGQVPPAFTLYSEATWLVRATWPGPSG